MHLRSIAFILVMLLTLGGCAASQVADPVVLLDLAGPVAVHVESFGGDVMIHADPTVEQPSVKFVREVVMPDARKGEVITALQQMDYSVQIVPGDMGQTLIVRTWSLHEEPHLQRVHLEITVPSVDGVEVRTERGAVEGFQLRGTVNISTVSGDVLLATIYPIEQPITISTSDGKINLRCRGESRGELDFHAVGGTVVSRIRNGRTIVHEGTDHARLLATFNDGQNPITLRTVGGDIRFVVVPDPLAFGQVILD